MKRRVVLALIILGAFAVLLALLSTQRSPSEAPAKPAPLAAPASPTEPEAPIAAATAAANGPAVVPAQALGRFDLAEDGTPLPALPDSAPARVKLGVALFTYQGAQGAAGSTRTPQAALKLAQAAIAGAGGDFSKIIAKADAGSRDDVGWIKRGILERRVEQTVFLLDKGATAKAPIDTPRGYWVVQRSQ